VPADRLFYLRLVTASFRCRVLEKGVFSPSWGIDDPLLSCLVLPFIHIDPSLPVTAAEDSRGAGDRDSSPITSSSPLSYSSSLPDWGSSLGVG